MRRPVTHGTHLVCDVLDERGPVAAALSLRVRGEGDRLRHATERVSERRRQRIHLLRAELITTLNTAVRKHRNNTKVSDLVLRVGLAPDAPC